MEAIVLPIIKNFKPPIMTPVPHKWLSGPAFLVLLAFFGHEIIDILRITLLHLVIGVFAYFMAAIFKQGVHLQEEQDLTF